MSILYGGGDDPKRVVYDGAELSKVRYGARDVWPGFPDSIDLVKITLGDNGAGGNVWLRDLTLRSVSHQSGSNDRHVYQGGYGGKFSVDMKWPAYEQISWFKIANMVRISWNPSTCKKAQYEGLPSSVSDHEIRFTANDKVSLEMKNSASGSPASGSTIAVDCSLTWTKVQDESTSFSMGFLGDVLSSTADVESKDLYAANSGLIIGERVCTVMFSRLERL